MQGLTWKLQNPPEQQATEEKLWDLTNHMEEALKK